ncbi:MAG: hypothetical protein AB7N76_10690 [Planctomycetota bacterium]
MTAPLLLDPFEHEVFLADEPRVLSFAPRAVEIPLDELLRHLAFDLVGAIPRPLGQVSEPLDEAGTRRHQSAFFQLGASVLAITTEISEPGARHRVLELLGIGEDVRVRLNLSEVLGEGQAGLSPAALAEVDEGRSLGQVRLWGNEPSLLGEHRRALSRGLLAAGLESRVLDRSVEEPVYRPPAADRLHLDTLHTDDLRVMEVLLALLRQMPVPGSEKRTPRQIAAHQDRVRRKGSIVGYSYETHRAGSGVLHIRRREVEAGAERPGLVRTFVVAGLAGGARLRIRDVGGRAVAEVAGSEAAVDAIGKALAFAMGGHG